MKTIYDVLVWHKTKATNSRIRATQYAIGTSARIMWSREAEVHEEFSSALVDLLQQMDTAKVTPR